MKRYVDYRFFVEDAKSEDEATDVVLEFLPDSTDRIWYTIIKTGTLDKK